MFENVRTFTQKSICKKEYAMFFMLGKKNILLNLVVLLIIAINAKEILILQSLHQDSFNTASATNLSNNSNNILMQTTIAAFSNFSFS